MGVPFFEIRPLVNSHGLVWLSSNYAFYGDISARMMRLLNEFTPRQETYSIDECFLDFSDMPGNATTHGRDIRRRIRQYLGITTCTGIGSSKTLAKLANHVAKTNKEYDGVFDWAERSAAEQAALMAGLPVGKVWGVGRKLALQLNRFNIFTVFDLQRTNVVEIRKRFSVVMERTVAELNGESRIELEEITAPKAHIQATRSFGRPVTTISELREAVMSYVVRAAERLREQHSVCAQVSVIIHTEKCRSGTLRDSPSIQIPLAVPSAHTRRLSTAALRNLEQIYRQGYRYKKAGVMLTGLQPVIATQADLFAGDNPPRTARLMTAMDAINKTYGMNTVTFAGAGIEQPWRMQSMRKSPRYTTCWNERATVR